MVNVAPASVVVRPGASFPAGAIPCELAMALARDLASVATR
jgi:hypothetical protein